MVILKNINAQRKDTILKRIEIGKYVITQNDYNYDVIIYHDKETVFREHYSYPLSEKQIRELFDNFVKDFESETSPKIKWLSEINKLSPEDRLITIFDDCPTLLAEEQGFAMIGIDQKYHISGTAILTTLIQYAGRYCETRASDLFIEWTESVEPLLRKVSKYDSEKLLIFAIRKNGVDSKEMMLSDKFGPYRQILALDIKKAHTEPNNKTMSIVMTLKNITEYMTNIA